MLARRDSKNVDGKRPLSATGAVGDKLKTEPVEQVLDPGSKSLGAVSLPSPLIYQFIYEQNLRKDLLVKTGLM